MIDFHGQMHIFSALMACRTFCSFSHHFVAILYIVAYTIALFLLKYFYGHEPYVCLDLSTVVRHSTTKYEVQISNLRLTFSSVLY